MELRAGGALSLAPEPREEGEYTNVSVCTNTEIAPGWWLITALGRVVITVTRRVWIFWFGGTAARAAGGGAPPRYFTVRLYGVILK